MFTGLKTCQKKKIFKGPKMSQLPQYAADTTQSAVIQLNTLDNTQQLKRLSNPMSACVSQRISAAEIEKPISIEQPILNTYSKSCQTTKVGIKTNGPVRSLSSMKDVMQRRRRMLDESDRARLKKLKDFINADPPPSWHDATIMWLDVDLLEKRIEAYEMEQAKEKLQRAEEIENQMEYDETECE
ncbi:uncharacterized protein LOC133843626 [Drosophila sulfurigaster albostrigata]|uniref:uncharacterized protein LOC133843626 n=1 Tax=Drosophila sulfurigaster albostrigata TaxID=89887 RepID=UPI002D218B59|nr:uncharacterized protein LOC133843626 [Drosophila sulfurigaster albostrigata]XP_062133253.1 uncharacterized protein LOC133843626 [Drosophila sulfurigaster albostrigata]